LVSLAHLEAALNRPLARGVSEVRASAEEAFESFCQERYGRIVSAVRVIVGDHATAEDVTQEAFARAYLHWAKLWPNGNPGGWVHKVATNLAISWRRRAGRELRAIARLGRRTSLVTDAPEAYPELHAAMKELPPRQRAAVALHYVLGMSMEEAAEAMGCRPGTVKSLLHGAREKLRQKLEAP
jgi:RNA polymerase sigma-70 factor (ECF subfamily)